MRPLLIVVAVLVPRMVVASPVALEARTGGRISIISGGEALARFAASASMRWDARWHTGLRFSVDADRRTQIYEPSGELGVWLHASRAIDVLLGWRIGYANFHFDNVTVNAFAVESIAELAFQLPRGTELRIAPLTVQAYYAGLWQLTLGAEVGLGWRL